MRGNLPPSSEDNHATTRPGVERAVTQFPRYTPAVSNPPNRVVGSGGHTQHTLANDGVFANLNAKPELGEKEEEQPPVSFNTLSRTFIGRSTLWLTRYKSPTSKQQQMQRPLIGKTPFSLQALHPGMKSTLTVYPSALCSVSCGTA